MMALDFLVSSSTVKAGLAAVWRGGGVQAVSLLTVCYQNNTKM